MIVLFKNGKIIGADTNLLQKLNADLNNLSNLISELELLISTRQSKTVSLNNQTFEVEEIPLVSIENIHAYNIQLTSEESLPKINLEEELLKIEPLNKQEITIKSPQIQTTTPSENLNIPITQEENFILETKPFVEEIKPETIEKTEEIKPIKTSEEIEISFENTFDEINEILSLDKKKANELIAQELQKAAEDLGIDKETINNLYIELLTQFVNAKKDLYNAIEKNDYENIHKIAHKLKGAALNLRLSKLALILKNIDEESKSKKPITQIKFLVDRFYDFLKKIENEKSSEIPESIKSLILMTIKDYLATQNEKKFKKDLKYIGKILNKQIDSLEDLQNLIKE